MAIISKLSNTLVPVICAVAWVAMTHASAAPKENRRRNVLHSFGSGADGSYPEAGLIDVKGRLYGTTSSGGAISRGTVFSVNANTGVEKVLYSFGISGAGDGGQPLAVLIDVNGILYGTTELGGANGVGTAGTVFSLKP